MNLSLKILCFIGCVLLGFVFPLAFIGAIMLGIGIYADVTKDHDAPGRHLERNGAASREYSEKSHFRSTSESPAEEAFFDAMQKHFHLEVKNGKLVGDDGISLDMQVEVLRYRLDFLVDKRLIVEVDGAAWHSSPEAVARDKARDATLTEAGYHILRLPAKLVFNDPDAAIATVSEARKQVKITDGQRAKDRAKAAAAGGAPVGTPLQQIGQSMRPKRMLSALGGALNQTSDILTKIHEESEKHRIHRENRQADIARATTPEMIAKLKQLTIPTLISRLVMEEKHGQLVELMNADDPKALANEMQAKHLEELERKRKLQEWEDENIPW